MENMFSLKGKVALVTGASYGIGFAIAKAFANAGATIVFNDIKQELVDKGLWKRIGAIGRKAKIRFYRWVAKCTVEAYIPLLFTVISSSQKQF